MSLMKTKPITIFHSCILHQKSFISLHLPSSVPDLIITNNINPHILMAHSQKITVIPIFLKQYKFQSMNWKTYKVTALILISFKRHLRIVHFNAFMSNSTTKYLHSTQFGKQSLPWTFSYFKMELAMFVISQ
jgi:hypothetical protein